MDILWPADVFVLRLFFFSRYRDHRDLHSFPTRRSSDLGHVARHDEDSRADHRTDHDTEGRDRPEDARQLGLDRKSTRLNSSHANISYAVFCLKKKKTKLLRVLQEKEIRHIGDKKTRHTD